MQNNPITRIRLVAIIVFVLAACAPKLVPTLVLTDSAAPAATEPPPSAPPATATNIVLWTKEGEADGGIQFVKSLADAFNSANPDITFEVINKETEILREDFQTASLAGSPPDLLWTVSDHAGPFTAADLIQPVDILFDMPIYNAAVSMGGKTWGVPISTGSHLMMIYNKDLVPTPPKDTDELIAMGKELTKGDTYGLVFNQTEPFWMVPWLGGFGGAVFAEDGLTPTLDTPEMVSTLKFLYDLKYTHKIIPPESDYDGADALFKEGKAGMIINGDWSLGGYAEKMADKYGTAAIPMVKETGTYPKAYTAGAYFMIPKEVEGDKLEAIKAFVEFVTNDENQLNQLETLKRLPGVKALLDNDMIKKDPILAGSAEDLKNGIPMPVVLEMRCNWDSMKPEMQAVLADSKSPEDAAKAMQEAADACLKTLE